MIARRWTSLLTLCAMLVAALTGAASPCAGQHDTPMPAMADHAHMPSVADGQSCHRPELPHHAHAPLSCITMSSCATAAAMVTVPRLMAEAVTHRVAQPTLAEAMSSIQLPPENPPPRA